MIGGFEGSDLVRAFLVIGFALVFVWLWRTRTRHETPRQESIKFGPLDVPEDATITKTKLTWPHLPRARR